MANPAKKNSAPFQKPESGVYAKRALPIPENKMKSSKPPPPRPPLDSTPTPVIEMGWRNIHARFELLASRLESSAFTFTKHPIKLDLSKASRCKELAEECRRIVLRVEEWPNKSGPGLAGEKSWVAGKYIDIVSEAGEMLEGKVL